MTIEQMIETRNKCRKRCGWIKYHLLCCVARLSINARAKMMQATFDQAARHLASEQKSEELRDIYLACYVDCMEKLYKRLENHVKQDGNAMTSKRTKQIKRIIREVIPFIIGIVLGYFFL